MKLKEYIKKKIPESKLKYIPSSFDIIGQVCIIEIRNEVKKYSKLIGNSILKLNPNIKTVFKKASVVKGKFRTHKLTFIAGLNNKEAICRENNTLFKLDVEKCYFSPRSGSERLRISNLVKKNESVLVMFSGIGAFNFVILKNSLPKEVYGIEANKVAHKYALENSKLNKIPENKSKLFYGDAKKVMLKINKKFDRILMPLPKESEQFLELALKKIKRNGIIHLYTFLEEPKEETREIKLDKYWRDIMNKRIEKYTNNFKILRIVKCGIYGPRIFRVCTDIKILK